MATLPSTPYTFKPISVPSNPIDGAVDPNAFVGPVQANGSSPSSLQQAISFLGTPGGSAVTNLAGAGLSAYGNYQQNQQNLQQNANQFAATSTQNQYNADQANKLARANGVLAADPLGADQQYAQKNALNAAILPNLRNVRSQPGDAAVAGAMGSSRGGIMNALPEGGLDPAMINSMFGPDATMQSITQRHNEISNLDPSAPTADLSKMYGTQAAAPYNQQQNDWQAKVASLDASQKADFENKMQGYINSMVQQEQQSGSSDGFWHKFARIAGVVGSVAAIALTGGAAAPILGPVAMGLLAGGSAAATAWGSGASPLQTAIAGGGAGAMAGFKANQADK